MDNGDAQFAATPRAVVNTLLLTDLVDSTRLVEALGDARAAEVFAQQDRLARDLLPRHHGREIDKTDGFLLLFDRPIDAVLYVLEYHEALRRLSSEVQVPLAARAGIHLGELIVKENPPDDVARGAKPVEVEGIAKPLAARIMSLARGGQTLLTRSAFDLARRAVVGGAAPADLRWMAHGSYLLKGADEPVEVFEVGVESLAPLQAPDDTEKARRSIEAGDEETLGWRPATGLPVPQRRAWILERKLVAGDFGEVWLAQRRQTSERRVFKFCFDAKRLRSLKRELTLLQLLRDALGDRKDIARLYEVQLDEPPFFLESAYTPSGSLEEWAEAIGGLSTVPLDVRVDLVARTARAVAAAHSVGIVHKDVRPSNVLIDIDADGSPRPQLADFGIGVLTDEAKLAAGDVGGGGLSAVMGVDDDARTGPQIYAPPEALAGRTVNALGDIYALGVLLYQMVVGDLDRPLATGWERDVQDPILRGDVAACVEGDEEQRLGSAQGLAKRLESLPSRRRAWRRGRRARLLLAAVSAVAALGIVAMVWGLRESGLRGRAEDELAKAREALEFLVTNFSQPNPWDYDGPDVTVTAALKYALADLDSGRLDHRPAVKAALLHAIGSTYRLIDKREEARAPLAEALALRREHLEPPHEDLATSIDEFGELLEDVSAYDAAERHYREALAMRRELERRSDRTSDTRLPVAESKQHLAALLNKTERSVEAEPLYREALAIRRELLDPDDRDVGRSLNNLGFCLMTQGRYDDALVQFREAKEIFEVVHAGKDHLELAGTIQNIGRCHMELDDLTTAEDSLKRALQMKTRILPTQKWKTLAKVRHLLGDLYLRMESPERAEEHLSIAFDVWREEGGMERLETAESEYLLGVCLLRLDRAADAQPLLVHAYDVLAEHPSYPARCPGALENLIETHTRLGQPEEARRYRELLDRTRDER